MQKDECESSDHGIDRPTNSPIESRVIKMTTINIKVSGLGHSFTLELPSTEPLGTLKSQIEQATDLLPAYQRLVCRGLKLDDDTQTLDEIGIKDRTKVMLLHSPLYAQEKETYEKLLSVSTEIDDLAGQSGVEPKVLTELVTRICCKLDAIDTSGSEHLRAKRKELLKKAESIEVPKEPNFK